MLDISIDTKGAVKWFDEVANKQLPFATKEALNKTAIDVMEAEKEHMRKVFDRPTPFIMNGLRIKFAKKKDLTAYVWFKDRFGLIHEPVIDAIMPHIKGGARKPKASERSMRRKGILKRDEFLVPAKGAPLDRYGNIRRGVMQKIMAQIGAFHDPHQNTPVQWTRKRGRRKEYIFGKVGNTKGVYQTHGDRWKLILLVVSGAPQYRKRFKFDRVGFSVAARVSQLNFDEALSNAIKTAK